MDLSFRDWAGIPVHLLDQIVIKINRFADYLRFHAVCQQWLCAALDTDVDNKVKLDSLKVSRLKLPMLMFKTKENSDDTRVLYGVTDKINYHIKLPLPYKHRFVGSSNGWLFYLGEDIVITMVNPFNDSTISLPVLKDPIALYEEEWHQRYFDYYISKVIFLSYDHINPGFVVALIHGDMKELAFFKSDECSWVFIDSEPDINFLLRDITFYKGNLYGLTVGSKLVKVDIITKEVSTIINASDIDANCLYLVESQDDELLLIQREDGEEEEGEDDHVEDKRADIENFSDDEALDMEGGFSKRELFADDGNFPKSYEFKVFKLTQSIDKEFPSWVQIKDIGEQALFLGDSHSMSVSTTDYQGCLPNSIYYTSQHHQDIFPYVYRRRNEDQGIFNIGSGTFSLHHVLDSSQKYKHPPIWFVPNPKTTNFSMDAV